MQRFELRDETTSKFWEIDVEENVLTVRFGKLGTRGQTQSKSLDSPQEARETRDELVRQKRRKGYREVVTEAPADGAEEDRTPRKALAKNPPEPAAEPGWLDAGNGYLVTLREGKVVARNARGKVLASVPTELKGSAAVEELGNVRVWLAAHEEACLETVETWMMRSLPVPRSVLHAIWPDRAWRAALENTVVAPLTGDGEGDMSSAGFLRGVDEERGVGVVGLDGESSWLDAQAFVIPHPILLQELDDFRSLSGELGVEQRISQLFRETVPKPAGVVGDARAVAEFRGGEFKMLAHALSICKKHGFRVRGGTATARVWQRGRVYEARYWIGADDPQSPAFTDELVWVDEREQPIPLAEVHPVAYSEGMRMAKTIFGGRVVAAEGA